MKWRLISSAVLSMAAIVFGQAEPTTGTLVGRVFAIAKDGETKPARIAPVYVATGADRISLQQSVDAALAKRADDLKSNTDPEQACLLASMSVHEAVKSDSSIQTANTDEDGTFDLPKLKAGVYTVVVIGAADGYQSVWYSTTTVVPGKRQKIKLSEPALSCQ